MNNRKKNIQYLVYSKVIYRIGDVMFDFANNTFLAGLNPASLSLVAVYQSLESIIGVLFNLFGGVIADSFKRKKNYYYYKYLMWHSLLSTLVPNKRAMVGLCHCTN